MGASIRDNTVCIHLLSSIHTTEELDYIVPVAIFQYALPHQAMTSNVPFMNQSLIGLRDGLKKYLPYEETHLEPGPVTAEDIESQFHAG